jgi:hypothetical protein
MENKNMETIVMKSPHEILLKLLWKEFERELSNNHEKYLSITIKCKNQNEFEKEKEKEFDKWLIENEYVKSLK